MLLKKVMSNKVNLLVLLVISLFFYTLFLNHQNYVLSKENEQFIENISGLYMSSISEFDFHALIFEDELSENASEEEFRQWRRKIEIIENSAHIHGFQNFAYLYDSMGVVIYNKYVYEEYDEWYFLLRELNRDVRNLVGLYLDSSVNWMQGKPISVTKDELYKRVKGLDPDFYQREKEFMDNLIKKYHNLTVEDMR